MVKLQWKSLDAQPLDRSADMRRHITIRQWLAGILVLLLLGMAGCGVYWYLHRNDQVIMKDRYQVVLLDDGKIFFGKMQNSRGAYITLTDPYYAQGETQKSSSATDSVSNSGVKIFKVTSESYGPENTMSIQSSKVQFWQNLRTDSKVVKAITSASQQ